MQCSAVLPIPLHISEQLHARCSHLRCRRVLGVLGGAFDYQAAIAELAAARRSAKHLLRGQAGAQAGRRANYAAATTCAAAAASTCAAVASSAASHEADLWGSFEAFAAAVAPTDRRIAAARLCPLPAAGERAHRQERAQPHVQHTAAAAPARQPLGSLQQGERPVRQAAGAGGPERKRERSPIAGHAESRPSRSAAAAPAAAPAPVAASQPASKRPRPHVAFGSRCGAPRPAAAKGAKPVRLNAGTAPLPPPLQQKTEASRQPAEAQAAGSVASSAARADLLRTLAAAFAGSTGSVTLQAAENAGAGPGVAATNHGSSGAGASSGREQMHQMLQELTAALQSCNRQPFSTPAAARISILQRRAAPAAMPACSPCCSSMAWAQPSCRASAACSRWGGAHYSSSTACQA